MTSWRVGFNYCDVDSNRGFKYDQINLFTAKKDTIMIK